MNSQYMDTYVQQLYMYTYVQWTEVIRTVHVNVDGAMCFSHVIDSCTDIWPSKLWSYLSYYQFLSL